MKLSLLEREDSEGRAIVLITDGRDSPQEQIPNWVDPLQQLNMRKMLGSMFMRLELVTPTVPGPTLPGICLQGAHSSHPA